MVTRRKFIRNVSLTAASGAFISSRAIAVSDSENGRAASGNIVISTWEHGLAANKKAMELLESGKRPVDAAQEGVMVVESDPLNDSVGLAGMPDRDGIVTLDACLMDEFGNAGAVCFLEGIEHPVAVARLVMDRTPHVMLAGEGAQQFAIENGFRPRKNELSPHAKIAYEKWLKTSNYRPVDYKNHDTIGLILRDSNGNFSGACTTSGLAYKIHGRVGDSPIIGAGLFVDPEVGAATATGRGESVVKICGSHLVVELMRMGMNPQRACEEAVKRISLKQKDYKDFQVGFLALNKAGETGAFSIYMGFDYALAKEGTNRLLQSSSLIASKQETEK